MNIEFTKRLNDTLSMKVSVGNQLELFQALHEYGEIFSISECGACKSDDVKYAIREVADTKKKGQFHSYYEMHCGKCRARLAFGKMMSGDRLFPKRKDENGNYLPNNGWVKFEKAEQKEE